MNHPAVVMSIVIAVACGRSLAGDDTIIDTGQTTFYNNTISTAAPSRGDAFYGQDAQFIGNAPSYTTTISGTDTTVLDNVTGLIWTHSSLDRLTIRQPRSCRRAKGA